MNALPKPMAHRGHILIIDDEPAHAEAIRRSLHRSQPELLINLAESLAEYRKIIDVDPPDLAILDLILADGRAESVLTFPPEDGAFPVIVMTSHGG